MAVSISLLNNSQKYFLETSRKSIRFEIRQTFSSLQKVEFWKNFFWLKYEDQKSIKRHFTSLFTFQNDIFQKLVNGSGKNIMHLCVLYQPGLIKVRKSQKEIVVPAISQKNNELFILISAVASKMVRMKKIKAHFQTVIRGYLTKQRASIFLWFDPF